MIKDLALNTGSWSGNRQLSRLNDMFYEMQKQFENMWSKPTYNSFVFEDIQPSSKNQFPKIDVFETEEEYIVEAAIAGFNKDDVSIEFDDNSIFIKGEKQKNIQDDNKRYLKREISKRSFNRVVRFPKKVLSDNIECNYSNGMIECKIKKQVQNLEEGPVKIEIN